MKRLSLAASVAGLAVILSGLVAAGAAHADTLTALLKNGPLAQVDVDKKGSFRKSRVLIDIDASVEETWAVLKDFKSYPRYMPTCEEVKVKQKGGYTYVDFELDTPLISTEYTSRYKLNQGQHRMDILVVDGDNKGSFFLWELSPTKTGTRVRYSGLVKNFSSIVESLDDDEQTITIGVNVVSLLQGAKALKRETERRRGSRKSNTTAK